MNKKNKSTDTETELIEFISAMTQLVNSARDLVEIKKTQALEELEDDGTAEL